jgi:hypothetical protein
MSLCITEFIGRAMLLHVSAHGAILRWYINNLKLLNYAFYMDPYISLTLIAIICTDYILYCFKNVLKQVFKLMKGLKTLTD